MNSMELKYGCNPNQKPARVFMKNRGNTGRVIRAIRLKLAAS